MSYTSSLFVKYKKIHGKNFKNNECWHLQSNTYSEYISSHHMKKSNVKYKYNIHSLGFALYPQFCLIDIKFHSVTLSTVFHSIPFSTISLSLSLLPSLESRSLNVVYWTLYSKIASTKRNFIVCTVHLL